MGNCLVLKGKGIRIIRVDGKILEYRAPMRVHRLLLQFPNHVVSESLPPLHHLRPDAEMLGGRLYYLLPLLALPPEITNNGGCGGGQQQSTGVVRIKLVISKQELKDMLGKGGVSSAEDFTSQLLNRHGRMSGFGVAAGGDDEHEGSRGWKPVLESIPEVN